MLLTAFDECPECGHDLRGLPPPHRCPECGFPYDQQTRIWRPGRSWTFYVPFALTLLFLPAIFRLLGLISLGRVPNLGEVLLAAIAVYCLCWTAPRLNELARNQRYAALTPDGIRARTARGLVHIPWEELGEVYDAFGEPRIRSAADGRAHELSWIFDSDREASEFRAALEEARRRYLSAVAGQPMSRSSVPGKPPAEPTIVKAPHNPGPASDR